MKRTYTIELDCTNMMEDTVRKNTVANFMMQKVIVEFEDGREAKRGG